MQMIDYISKIQIQSHIPAILHRKNFCNQKYNSYIWYNNHWYLSKINLSENITSKYRFSVYRFSEYRFSEYRLSAYRF